MKRRHWLIKLRKKENLTQDEVAKKAGIERSTYTKAENGYSVSISTAKAIATIFNVNWYIFFDDNCDLKGQIDDISA